MDSISNISLISYSTIPMKIGNSNSKTAKYLLEMFVELFITSSALSSSSITTNSSSNLLSTPIKGVESNDSNVNIIDKAIDFMNRYISNPIFSDEVSLMSLLTGLYCLRGIDLCCSLILENYLPQSNSPTLTERYDLKKKRKQQKNLITKLLEDRPENTSINLLCPTCPEICATPMLFAETLLSLRLYDLKYSK